MKLKQALYITENHPLLIKLQIITNINYCDTNHNDINWLVVLYFTFTESKSDFLLKHLSNNYVQTCSELEFTFPSRT